MELTFTLVGCGTWVLDIDGTFKIGCDPSLDPAGTRYVYKGLGTRRLKEAVYDGSMLSGVKLWLFSHAHFDHIDDPGLARVATGVRVLSQSGCKKLLKKRSDLDVGYLSPGQVSLIEIEGCSVETEAIPASHGTNAFARFLMEGVIGFRITISKNGVRRTVYASSDTVFQPAIVEALKGRPIDLFIANQGNIKPYLPGGPFTMNRAMLDRFVAELNPAHTLPIHIDDFAHFNSRREEYLATYTVLENGESYTVR